MSVQISLTRRARDLLVFIQEYGERNAGIMPTFDEMRHHLEVASKSTVARVILQLEERGHIIRLPHCARAMKLVEPSIPVSLSPEVGHAVRHAAKADGKSVPSYIAEIVEAHLRGPHS